MVAPADPETATQSGDPLKRLADAYNSPTPTLNAIADSIVASAQLAGDGYQRDAVKALVACIAEDDRTLNALEVGAPVPSDVLHRMADLVASDPPATVPEWDFLNAVLDNVRLALAQSAMGGQTGDK